MMGANTQWMLKELCEVAGMLASPASQPAPVRNQPRGISRRNQPAGPG
jgi:hypothetical protein